MLYCFSMVELIPMRGWVAPARGNVREAVGGSSLLVSRLRDVLIPAKEETSRQPTE